MFRCGNIVYIQSTSAISNARYLELSLSRTFSRVPSAFPVTFPIITFGISNPAISNFHYVEQHFAVPSALLSRYLELFHFDVRFLNKIVRKNWDSIECLSLYVQERFLYNRNKMSVKRKLVVKSLNEKCKALRDLESGLSNKEVAVKNTFRLLLPLNHRTLYFIGRNFLLIKYLLSQFYFLQY